MSETGTHRGPTIYDVARHAQVSPSTVSRVMNGISGESSQLAAKVRESARELGFVPNRTAVNLSRQRTQTVGVVVPDLENPAFQTMLRGIEESAASNDYNVLVANSAEDTTRERAIAERLRGSADAVILCAPRMSTADLAEIAPGLSPLVIVNRYEPDLPMPSVAAANQQGMALLAEHLVGLGHRRLLFLRGHPHSTASRERAEGLSAFAAQHTGISVLNDEGGVTFESGYHAAESVVRSGASAVLAFNDLVAAGLLSALADRGLHVPQELSVVGFDDVLFAGYTSPPLTTVRVPYRELGGWAWRRTWEQLSGTGDATQTVLPSTLVVRGSSAPAPG